MAFIVRGLLASAIALSLITASVNVAAHAVIFPGTAETGTYARIAIRISHGCEGSATTAIHVTIPPGAIGARAQAKPGWNIVTEKGSLQSPAQAGHSRQVQDTTSAIIWRQGSLPDDQFDEFGLTFFVDATPGQVLAFPVVQTCGSKDLRWVETAPAAAERTQLAHPAPTLEILPARDTSHTHR